MLNRLVLIICLIEQVAFFVFAAVLAVAVARGIKSRGEGRAKRHDVPLFSAMAFLWKSCVFILSFIRQLP